MKNLKDKFKKKINFVKPLYKKVNPKQNIQTKREFISVDIDNRENLCGDGIDAKNNISKGRNNTIKVFHKNSVQRYNIVVPDARQNNTKADVISAKNNCSVRNVREGRLSKKEATMLGIAESTHRANEENCSTHKLPDTWLRVYPAPILRNESVCSIAFRFLMCQMGLSVFLCFWTVTWVLVIHQFEGPFEKQVSEDFRIAQNQLVIDLATELRQITPLSPKWRKAIEDRIEAERLLTIASVAQGAKLHPGHFWDIAGTFLFTVYVMTALGFGAPVPQTIGGRSATLIYAIVTVPSHIVLMVHLSTSVVVNVEHCVHRLKTSRRDRPQVEVGSHSNKTESPSCSRNSELKPNRCKLRKRIISILGIVCVGRCVPLAAVLYYIIGVMGFGIARSRQPLEVIMFPLEFTTTGGLEHVECYVRVIYGIYVEGAMILLSCALATLRRHSSGPMSNMSKRYRLFAQEKQDNQ